MAASTHTQKSAKPNGGGREGAILRIVHALGIGQVEEPTPHDILTKLHGEHEQFKELLDEMLAAEGAAKRATLFKTFKTALTKHARAEEKVLYERLIARHKAKSRLVGFEGNVEHEVADVLVAKATKIRNKASNEWTATIKVLKEILSHHIREEEGDVFAQVRENFTHDERHALGEEFDAQKKKVRA